jgi:hypothetical protein
MVPTNAWISVSYGHQSPRSSRNLKWGGEDERGELVDALDELAIQIDSLRDALEQDD